MKKTIEIKADGSGEITFDMIERLISQAKAEGAGPLGTRVKAVVRFNGTLRALSIEMESKDTKEDDAWLARQM
jgi:hypothetical protein